MQITAALAADLATLSAALDDPSADIEVSLHALAVTLRQAVDSYRGLRVLAGSGIGRLDLLLLDGAGDPAPMGSSVLLPLLAAVDGGSAPAVAVVVYAGNPGSFVDLTADLSWLTGRPVTEFVLDHDLSPSADGADQGQVAAAARINQAIGVLIERGYSPLAASAELDARARNDHGDRLRAAADIIATLTEPG